MPADYEILKEIGSGTYGQVVKARHVKSEIFVAIKLLKNCFRDIYNARKVISEIQIMRKLTALKDNCFTTHIFDVITPAINSNSSEPIDYVFIVMDYD